MMKTHRVAFVFPAALALLLSSVSRPDPAGALEDGKYGSITGQFVLDGAVPAIEFLVAKGDATVKDPNICAADGVVDDTLTVDGESKGILDIFVYIRKADEIHPDLEEAKETEVVFDQKGCRFKPHCLIVRTDQKVVVKSGDACAHNTHTYPIRGQAVNFILKPNDREGVKVPVTTPEILPIPVKCDIHAWMKANWLILDHPYAALTNEQGKFTIEKMPAGEYEFVVWQERPGYLSGDGDRKKVDYPSTVAGTKRGFSVTIKPGARVDIGKVLVPESALAKE